MRMHIMNVVFNALDAAGVRYAHFKSNVNLKYSFDGTADFDIIVEKARLHEAQAILSGNHCKRFNTITEKNYPGVDNWLVFDPEDGKIYHIHLHCQLVTGKPLLKDYIIPWGDILLQTRVYDETWGIYKSDPNLELLLLLVRSVVKTHTRVLLKARLGSFRLKGSMDRERELLLAQIDPVQVEHYCERLFDPNCAAQVCRIALLPKWTGRDFVVLSKIVRQAFKDNRRFGPLQAWSLSKAHVLRSKLRSTLRRKIGRMGIQKKTSEKGGAILTFVGVDGAGKSTVTKEICAWLSPQIECTRFYMGSGDGKVNLFTRLFRKLRGGKGKVRSSAADEPRNEGEKALRFMSDPVGYLKKTVGMVSTYCIEKDHYKTMKQMARYRGNGGICLLDRFPQKEIENANDGPKLCRYEQALSNSRLYRHLHNKERDLFEITDRVAPDVVFRINISADTSMKRKPEQTDIEVYEEKIRMLEKITFNQARMVQVDGEQDYSVELLQIKRAIWELL